MVKQRVWGLALVLLAIAAFAGAAVADDLTPPPWRGLPDTTHQEWVFNSPSMTPPPDAGNNPYGLPAMNIQPLGPWQPTWMNRQGVWPLSGRIDVEIPNTLIPNPLKLIQVQLTWWSPTGALPTVEETMWPGQSNTQIAGIIPLPGGWTHGTWLIELRPNPQFERISIFGDVYVDQLVIDTWCVPEPGALAVLASGLLGMAGVMRRRT